MAGVSIRDLESFGKGAAEDEPVLEYFLTTDAVQRIAGGEVMLILGRKGSGKTALVRHFSEGAAGIFSRSISLRGYPWTVHATRRDGGASAIEAYVSSWRYLIAVELAALIVTRAQLESKSRKALRSFLMQNYGGPDPLLEQIIRPPKLTLTKAGVEPAVLGCKLGGIALERDPKDLGLGLELNALTEALLAEVRAVAADEGIEALSLHFDELDQGMAILDESRTSMLVGLVLAARSIRQGNAQSTVQIRPVIYLRSDLWEDFEFSDKNKIARGLALNLEWNSGSLSELIMARIAKKLGPYTWADLSTPDLMRGSQTKWNHILARTFLRPRDVIEFSNIALDAAKRRSNEPLLISNQDVISARERYSAYLKEELDDEIVAHWPRWDEALKACSAIQTLTFEREKFMQEYERRRSDDNHVNGPDALKPMYRFSVLGYERRSGYGGRAWVFQYTDPEAGWDDSAGRYKVHQGLKEYAKLNEERQ